MILADSGVVTGLFTLGGVAITLGVTATLEVSRRKHEDSRRWNNDLRQIYADFLAIASQYEKGDEELRERLTTELSLARDRIELLGSEKVYEATLSFYLLAVLHESWRHTDREYDPDAIYGARLKVAATMREDLGVTHKWRDPRGTNSMGGERDLGAPR